MEKKVAEEIIENEIAILRKCLYQSLRDKFLDNPQVKEIMGSDGKNYEVEIEAFWDDRPGGDLRVIVNVSGKSMWRTISPYTENFIISPTGEFIGE
jgi:hypothetical protein